MVDSPAIHAYPVGPMDVILDLNLENGKAKLMSGRCVVAETPG